MGRIWQLLYLSTSKSERQKSWNKSNDLIPVIPVQYLLADLLLCAWYLWKHRHGIFRNLPVSSEALTCNCNCKEEAGSQTLGLLVAASCTYTGAEEAWCSFIPFQSIIYVISLGCRSLCCFCFVTSC